MWGWNLGQGERQGRIPVSFQSQPSLLALTVGVLWKVWARKLNHRVLCSFSITTSRQFPLHNYSILTIGMNFWIRNFCCNKEWVKVYNYIFLHSTRFLTIEDKWTALAFSASEGKKIHIHTPWGKKKQQDWVLLSSSIERGEACLAVCGSESNYQSLTFINRLKQVNFFGEEEVDILSEFWDYVMIIKQHLHKNSFFLMNPSWGWAGGQEEYQLWERKNRL